MSFIAKLFTPKPPAPPVFIMPEPEKVPEVDSAEDKARLAEEMRLAENKRRGRRSTILTTSAGLNDEDAEISEKSLLG
jgi:hypothetical protein